MATAKRVARPKAAHLDPESSLGKSATKPRTYVIDTSVLLADPGALKRFEEHEVVLPVVVITELEGKRHHPELGYFAR
ncbi:MAG: PIN domain-containing protein, partial [Marmoricola sp.]